MKSAALAILFLAALTACGTVPQRPARLESSSYGCMSAVVKKLPAKLADKRAHCLASGLIARYCGVPEAYLAGMGKEVRDLFTPGGDAEWADWRADRVGVRCARHAESDEALAACCPQ